MGCICCHAQAGLHTADCRYAFRKAYDKATLDAAGLCEELAYTASTHSATELALSCALAIKSRVGHADA